MAFADQLKTMMDNQSMTMYRISKDIGVHPTTIKNWLDGKAEPRASELVKIADTLGVTLFDLIEIPQEQTINSLLKTLRTAQRNLQSESANGELSDDKIEMYNKVFFDINELLDDMIKRAKIAERARKVNEQANADVAAMAAAKEKQLKNAALIAKDKTTIQNANLLFQLLNNLNDDGQKKLIEFAEILKDSPRFQSQQ